LKHFNIILSYSPRYPKLSLTFIFSGQNFVCISQSWEDAAKLLQFPCFILKSDWSGRWLILQNTREINSLYCWGLS
jgi:hypothetical protein